MSDLLVFLAGLALGAYKAEALREAVPLLKPEGTNESPVQSV